MSDQEPSTSGLPDPDRIATPADFGGELTLLRNRAGLTARQLAGAADVPLSTVSGYMTGNHLPLATNLEPFLRILSVCGENDGTRIEQWKSALGRVQRAPGRRSSSRPAPYRGLDSFRPEDAALFHGRERITRLIADRVEADAATGAGPLFVVGPSGAGKSSILCAGVLPELRRRGYTCESVALGPRPIRLPDVVPGDRSVLVLDQFEALFAPEVTEEERRALLDGLFDSGLSDPGRGVAIVVGLRADFYAQALRYPSAASALQTNQVVVGPMTETELRAAITEPARQSGIDVEPGLVELALRDLAPRGGGAKPTAAYEPGTLPLLSYSLLAAWERSRGNRMTAEDYLGCGGITRAVAQSAETVFERLQDSRRDIARRLFTRLVRTDPDFQDTRRVVTHAELLQGHTPAEAADIQEVLNRFIEARLVTSDEDAVEISHEALITAWPRLREWLDADRAWLSEHSRLTAAANDWQRAGRVPDLLYRGGTLGLVREWVDGRRYREFLNLLERDFLDASVARQADDAARDRRRTRRRYGIVAVLAVLAVVAAGSVVAVLQADATSGRDQAQALSRFVAAESDRMRDRDVSLSMQLALAAYRIWPTPEARSSLLNATDDTADTRVIPASGGAESVAVTGDQLAVGTDDGSVELSTVGASGAVTRVGRRLPGPEKSIVTLAFTHGGHELAGGGKDDKVYLWDTTNPNRPVALPPLTGPTGEILTLAISPDGRTVAAGSADHRVYLWDIAAPGHTTPVATMAGPTADVSAVAFTPDGGTLAAGSYDRTVRLWGVSDPARPAASSVLTVSSKVFSVAVSPDGRTLAAGTSEGHDVVTWNLADPRHPAPEGAPLSGPTSWVNSVAFSPDGRALAAASSDGMVWLYDLHTRQPVEELPHPSPVTMVRYRTDGSVLTVADNTARSWQLPGPVFGAGHASNVSFDANGHELGVGPALADDKATVWDPTDPQHPVALTPPLADPPGAAPYDGTGALSPDGRVFAVGDTQGGIQFWNIADPSRPALLEGPITAAGDLIESVGFSNDGRLFAAAADDGTVHLYDVSDPRRPASLAVLAPPGSGPLYSASFDPSGRLLAAAGVTPGHVAYLWDIANRTHPRLLATLGGFTSATYAASFSPDGHTLAVASADATVRLWDVTDPARPVGLGRLTGPVGDIDMIEFAPNRDVLAAASTDGTVWLWDLSRPRQPVYLATLTGLTGGVGDAAFGPDGRTLAAVGTDGTVRLWNTDPGTAAAWICSVAGAPVTAGEWAKYVPGRSYDPPCP